MLFSTLKQNILKSAPSLTGEIGGAWFLQIVDRDSWNLYPLVKWNVVSQIVDRDSGNLYPIYINKNCCVSF